MFTVYVRFMRYLPSTKQAIKRAINSSFFSTDITSEITLVAGVLNSKFMKSISTALTIFSAAYR